MALSALAPTALDDDEADDYRLHEVWLHDFKSYAGAVRVGPFHPRLNVVVGPNGCGKSCLVSGIGFALGLAHERASASLVNHASGGSRCAAAVHFRRRRVAASVVAQDTRRVEALADVLKARVGAQTIAVSHRPPMVEAACTLVGAYARPGASGSASLRFG